MTFEEKIAAFTLEYFQGITPDWLVKKYGFIGLIEWNGKEFISLNNDGKAIINSIKNPNPHLLAKVAIQEREEPKQFPWGYNPQSFKPKE